MIRRDHRYIYMYIWTGAWSSLCNARLETLDVKTSGSVLDVDSHTFNQNTAALFRGTNKYHPSRFSTHQNGKASTSKYKVSVKGKRCIMIA